MARNLFLAWTLSLLCLQAMAQTSSQNYIVEKKLLDASGTRTITTVTYYDALSSEMVTDEDGGYVETFTNLYGKKVLERRNDGNDTYYVYDKISRLRFVLPPSYQEEADLEKYAYEYRYDARGRCIWKRLPGCEYEQLWYDYASKLMFSQNGEQRRKGIYVFYAYDFDKRQVLQGTTTSINASCLSAIAKYDGSASGICNTGYVTKADMGLKNAQLLTASYYDNHKFLDGQLARQATTYSYTKKPATVTTTVTRGNVTKTVVQTNTYNQHNDQIESIALEMDGVRKTIASYTYDDLGRQTRVQRGGNAGIVSNEYNVRGWLTSTTSPKFQQTLSYEQGGAEPCYNGNISRMQWKTGNDNVLRGYDFYYDKLSRLTSSHYAEGSGMDQNKERYSENILSYSPNGAIEKLQRYGKRNNDTFGLIDDLTYQYNGNQIKAISDKAGSLLYDGSFDFKDGVNEATEYFYDGNGALTKDLNKGIGNIEYDVLGNPQYITFANGNKTKYVYDADGSKLRTTHESVVTNTTDYAGNFVFEDGKLAKYLFEGGYCSFDANLQPTYHYYEKDHLGSVRMVVNENGTIEQVNHYYPFGGVYGDLSYNSELQRNKYIGKELDHTDGLDWYDHGARMYDAAKVSWDRMEPLYDKYYHLNPYLYSGDNPINSIDNTGEDSYYLTDGTYVCDNLKQTDNIYIISNYKYLKQFSDGSKQILLSNKKNITESNISAEAYSNIFTNILQRYGFDVKQLKNGKISVNVLEYNKGNSGAEYELKDFANNPKSYPYLNAPVASESNTNEGIQVTANVVLDDSERRGYLSTVSNIVNVLGVHEFYGHGILGYKENLHWKILKMQMKHPSWKKTTKSFKELYDYLKRKNPTQYLSY